MLTTRFYALKFACLRLQMPYLLFIAICTFGKGVNFIATCAFGKPLQTLLAQICHLLHAQLAPFG